MVFGDKNSDLFLLHKIKYFGLKKYQICFLRTKKKKGFWIYKRSDMFLLHKIKSFGLKKVSNLFFK